MQRHGLLYLAVVTVVAVLAAAWAVYERQQAAAVAAVPELLYPGLLDKVNDVTAISVTTPEGQFTIVKGEADAWSMPEKGGYPVKFETVKQAVVGMAALQPLEAKTAKPELLPKLELKTPAEGGKGTLIRLQDGAGDSIASVVVGKTRSVATSTRPGWHYVRKGEETQSWLAAGRIEVWDKPIRWLSNEMPVIKRQRVRRVTTVKPDGERISISRDDPEGRDFKVDDIPEGYKMLHDTAANALGSALGFLGFDDVFPAADKTLEDATVAEYQTWDGLVFTVRLAKQDGKYLGRIEARFEESAVAVDSLDEADREHMKPVDEVQQEVAEINRRYGPWVYEFPGYKGDDFMTPLSGLIVKDEARSTTGG